MKYKTILIGLLSLLIFACSENELSEADIQKIVQKHYDSDPFFTEAKTEIKLIKNVAPDYKAILVKIDDKKYASGFINSHIGKFVASSEFEKQDNKITFGANWGVRLVKTINGKTSKDNQPFSVFYGIVPYTGFMEIEMSWNCQTPDKTELVDGEYFFFAYPQHNMRRCNEIYLIDKNGKKTTLKYQHKNKNGEEVNGFTLE